MILGKTKSVYDMDRDELLSRFRNLKGSVQDMGALKKIGLGIATVGALAGLGGIIAAGSALTAVAAVPGLVAMEVGLGAGVGGLITSGFAAMREKFLGGKVYDMADKFPGIERAAQRERTAPILKGVTTPLNQAITGKAGTDIAITPEKASPKPSWRPSGPSMG